MFYVMTKLPSSDYYTVIVRETGYKTYEEAKIVLDYIASGDNLESYCLCIMFLA